MSRGMIFHDNTHREIREVAPKISDTFTSDADTAKGETHSNDRGCNNRSKI